MSTAINSALVVAGVMVFFGLMRSGANRPALRDPATGDLVLQPGNLLVWTMGLIAVGGPLGMAILSFIIPFQNPRQVYVPIVLGAFFLLLGGLMCFWSLRRRTRLGESGLTSEYMLAAPRFLAWQDVVKVSFASGQEFWIYGADGTKAMIHILLFTGVKEAAPVVMKHLPEIVRQEYRVTIERFMGAVGAG